MRCSYTLGVLFLLALHAALTLGVHPVCSPFDRQRACRGDEAVHAQRIQHHRDAVLQGDLPWGCNPRVSAGLFASPKSDVGAKAMEWIGLLRPSADPILVVRSFTFAVFLLRPLVLWVACSMISLPQPVRLCALALGILITWLKMGEGLVAFSAATALCPLVLVAFERMVAEPSPRRCFGAATALAAQVFLHVLGPVVLVPALLHLAAAAPRPRARTTLGFALAGLGAVAVNLPWLVPLALGVFAPPPPWSDTPAAHMDRDLTWTGLRSLLGSFTFPRTVFLAVGLALALRGGWTLDATPLRRLSRGILLAVATGFALKYAGSFLPLVSRFQTVRFGSPAVWIAVIPAAVGLVEWTTHLTRRRLAVSALVLACLVVGLLLDHPGRASREKTYAGYTTARAWRLLQHPVRPPDPSADAAAALDAFALDRFLPSDRVLVQMTPSFDRRVLPPSWKCETVGSSYPLKRDPIQFLSEWVLGRPLAAWTPDTFRAALDRWGISWVCTFTPPATELCSKALGTPGLPVGTHTVFRVGAPADRFLIGTGCAGAGMNRIVVTDAAPNCGLIVLRYRYHPAWTLVGAGQVEPYPVPEDPGGLLAVRSPSGSFTLRFDPWRMLFSRWPEKRRVP